MGGVTVTIAVLVVVVWIGGSVVLLALCRAAARGDAAMRREKRWGLRASKPAGQDR